MNTIMLNNNNTLILDNLGPLEDHGQTADEELDNSDNEEEIPQTADDIVSASLVS